jgi:fumarate reductase subunit C
VKLSVMVVDKNTVVVVLPFVAVSRALYTFVAWPLRSPHCLCVSETWRRVRRGLLRCEAYGLAIITADGRVVQVVGLVQ